MPSGGYSGGDPPVPIPNTEVKPSSADGTGGGSPRESRSLPGGQKRPGLSDRVFVFFAHHEAFWNGSESVGGCQYPFLFFLPAADQDRVFLVESAEEDCRTEVRNLGIGDSDPCMPA